MLINLEPYCKVLPVNLVEPASSTVGELAYLDPGNTDCLKKGTKSNKKNYREETVIAKYQDN